MVLFLLILFLPSGASPGGSTSGAPRAIFPDGSAFRLEIPVNSAERARGYMFRDRVAPDEGMLFRFPDTGFHTFWMKNCRVPLDIIWLEEDLSVVHIETDLPPCSSDPCPSYGPMRKARHALEVRAGTVRQTGLKLGDVIRLEGVNPTPLPTR
jgi:hypothetical protein